MLVIGSEVKQIEEDFSRERCGGEEDKAPPCKENIKCKPMEALALTVQWRAARSYVCLEEVTLDEKGTYIHLCLHTHKIHLRGSQEI